MRKEGEGASARFGRRRKKSEWLTNETRQQKPV